MIYGGDGQLAIELRLCSVYCDTSMTGTVLSFLTTCRFEVKKSKMSFSLLYSFFYCKISSDGVYGFYTNHGRSERINPMAKNMRKLLGGQPLIV